MPELKRNILNLDMEYISNMRECFSHSFDRFYAVAKFELPRVEDLKLTIIEFDSKCTYLAIKDTQKNSYFPKLLVYCLKLCYMWSFTKNK